LETGTSLNSQEHQLVEEAKRYDVVRISSTKRRGFESVKLEGW